MEIHRSVTPVMPEAAAEEATSAVAALHKSLVAIRKELVKKNEIIEQMTEERDMKLHGTLCNGANNDDQEITGVIFQPILPRQNLRISLSQRWTSRQ
jgi:hypothetical protein